MQKSAAQYSQSQFSSKCLSQVCVHQSESSPCQFLSSGPPFTPAISSPVCLYSWPRKCPAVLSALSLSSVLEGCWGYLQWVSRPPAIQTDPCGFFFFVTSNFKGMAQNFLSGQISGSSYGVLVSTIFCQLPSVFDPLLAAIFSQGNKFPAMHRHPGWASSPHSSHRHWMSFPPGYVMNHSAKSLCQNTFSQSHSQYALGISLLPQLLPSESLGLLMCLCYAMCLIPSAFCPVALYPIPSLLFCKIWGDGGVHLLSRDLCSDLPCYSRRSQI